MKDIVGEGRACFFPGGGGERGSAPCMTCLGVFVMPYRSEVSFFLLRRPAYHTVQVGSTR